MGFQSHRRWEFRSRRIQSQEPLRSTEGERGAVIVGLPTLETWSRARAMQPFPRVFPRLCCACFIMKETEARVDTRCQGHKEPELRFLSARILGQLELASPLLLLKSARQRRPARPQSRHLACSSPQHPERGCLQSLSVTPPLPPVRLVPPSLF